MLRERPIVAPCGQHGGVSSSSSSPHALTPLEIAAIVAVLVIWGVNNAAAKVATEVLPPLMTGALRFAIAAACLVFTVTGLFILQMHAGNRPFTWPVAGLGLLVPVLLALLLIH